VAYNIPFATSTSNLTGQLKEVMPGAEIAYSSIRGEEMRLGYLR